MASRGTRSLVQQQTSVVCRRPQRDLSAQVHVGRVPGDAENPHLEGVVQGVPGAGATIASKGVLKPLPRINGRVLYPRGHGI